MGYKDDWRQHKGFVSESKKPNTSLNVDVVANHKWCQVQGKIKGNDLAIQRENSNNNNHTFSQGYSRMEGPKKGHWKRKVCDKMLLSRLQIDSVGRVVQPSNNIGFCNGSDWHQV